MTDAPNDDRPDLDELERKMAEAAPLPWVEDDCNFGSKPIGNLRMERIMRRLEGKEPHEPPLGELYPGDYPPEFIGSCPQCVEGCDENAVFIVAAVNALPTLIAAAREREQLRQQVEELGEAFQATSDDGDEWHAEAERLRGRVADLTALVDDAAKLLARAKRAGCKLDTMYTRGECSRRYQVDCLIDDVEQISKWRAAARALAEEE